MDPSAGWVTTAIHVRSMQWLYFAEMRSMRLTRWSMQSLMQLALLRNRLLGSMAVIDVSVDAMVDAIKRRSLWIDALHVMD